MGKPQAIFVHMGQGGIQLGSAFWEMNCNDCGIDPDGKSIDIEECEFYQKYFDMGNENNYVPRAVFIDSESIPVDELKTGVFRNLFNSDMMINHHEDSANNYARGCFFIGKQMISKISDCIRKAVEKTENLDGFFFTTCMGGGTGSGITPLVLLYIVKEFPKIPCNLISICPSDCYSTSIVEPYNMLLNHFSIFETSDLNILCNNESIYNICRNKLNLNVPSFTHINYVISLMLGGIVSHLNDQYTNLVPFPRIHYPIIRYAPLSHISRQSYDLKSTTGIVNHLFSKDASQSVSLDVSRGLFMAASINFRGCVNAPSIYQCLSDLKWKQMYRFVDWSPSGFKITIDKRIPSVISQEMSICYSDQSASMLLNSTSIIDCFHTISRKFNLLFAKKAFIFWYLNEGMELNEFDEARYELDILTQDFQTISMSEADLASEGEYQ